MSLLPRGKVVQVHSYKHDGSVHRIWQAVTVLEEDEKRLIACNYRTRVIESDGRYWSTKEPAVCYFFKDYWFNIIGMLKKDGVHFYCNLSSPYLYDGEAVKYIDYDLDVRVQPTGAYTILDRDEYRQHMNRMDYPEELKLIIESQLNVLLDMIKNKQEPFTPGFIKHYYELYKSEKSKD